MIITDKNIDGGKAFAWEEFDILHYAAMVELKKNRPLLKIDIDEKETGRLVWGAYKYIDLQGLRERGMVEEYVTAAERRRIERGAENGGLSPAT